MAVQTRRGLANTASYMTFILFKNRGCGMAVYLGLVLGSEADRC